MRTDPVRCLSCGSSNDGHTGVNEGQLDDTMVPSPGDLSICVYCGALAAYGDGLRLRELTDDERVDALADQRVVRAVYAIQATKLLAP